MFNSNVNPLFPQIQQVLDAQVKRRTHLKGLWVGLYILLGLFLVTLWGAIFMCPVTGKTNATVFIIPAVFLIVLIIYAATTGIVEKKKELGAEYKQQVVEPILKQYFNTEKVLFWTSDSEENNSLLEPKSVLHYGGLFPIGSKFECDDICIIPYAGKTISLLDVDNKTETEDSDGHTSTVTIFKGQVCVVPFPKTVKLPIRIIDKEGDDYAWHKNGITTCNPFSNKKVNWESIETENPNFNKYFYIYCEKDAGAFYALTPQLIEALLTLRTQMNRKMIITIVGNLMYVAFDTNKSIFETNLDKEFSARDAFVKICNEAYPIKLLCNAIKNS